LIKTLGEEWHKAQEVADFAPLLQAGARTAISTLAVHRRMCQLFPFVVGKEKENMYPDAVERFGMLTEFIQIKASLALFSMNRRGLRIDLEKRHKAFSHHHQLVKDAINSIFNATISPLLPSSSLQVFFLLP